MKPKYLAATALILFMLFYGCASGPPGKYKIDSTVINSKESGIVFGKVTLQRVFGVGSYNADLSGGRWVGLKSIETGENFGYRRAHLFEFKLPEGNYQIISLGSPTGLLIPKERPFTFHVDKGDIKYIGSIVGDRDLLRHLEAKNITIKNAYTEVISIQEYGVARPKEFFSSEYVPKEPFITFFIVDQRDEDIADFLAKYPIFKDNKIKIDIMK